MMPSAFLPTNEWLSRQDRWLSTSVAWLETSNGCLVIVKSGYKNHWSLPGGVIDANETPLMAVKREVKEEIGIELPLTAFEFQMVASRKSLRFGMTYQFVFHASVSDAQYNAIVLQPSEIDESRLITKEEVMHGTLALSATICAWANGAKGYQEQEIS